MTRHGNEARAFLSKRRLPQVARLAGPNFRWHVAESFVKHRNDTSGDELAGKIRADLEEANAIPQWMISILVNVAIKALIALLEKWWNKPKDTWGFVGHA